MVHQLSSPCTEASLAVSVNHSMRVFNMMGHHVPYTVPLPPMQDAEECQSERHLARGMERYD